MPTLMFAAMLASLFGFLYVLLGLETYSLLIGALALFVVVSALMVLTQMVKWPGPPARRGGGGMSDLGSARDFAAIIAAPDESGAGADPAIGACWRASSRHW